MGQKDIYILMISASATILIFCLSLIILFILFQRRREAYLQEINKIRIEVQEQTLKNISSEIHDNIGQILSTISIYGHTLLRSASEDLKPKIKESQDLVEKAIVEVRALSKALNTDYVKNVGLLESIEAEVQRLKRLRLLNAELEIIGSPYRLNQETELILLRILQEFFSNTLKYAKANSLKVTFEYNVQEFIIMAQDNGIGFEAKEIKGTGLINMKNRAKVIGAILNFDSQLNKGTLLYLKLPKLNKLTNE